MSIERMPGGTLFADRKKEPNVHESFQRALTLLIKAKEEVDPLVFESLEDEKLFNALPAEVKNSDEKLAEYILHCSKFSFVVGKERHSEGGLFGPTHEIPETAHADERMRRAEAGTTINVDYLRTVGIDPSKVLFFRVTQPSTTPKPEYYWTSDYIETQRGLQQEIAGERRKTAITLVADLETINKNGGLIQDINDDQGLAVRQIGTDGFDQSNTIAILPSAK